MSRDKLEPHWKTDFSMDWEETSFITRREFTRFLALGSAAMAAGNVLLAATSGLRADRTRRPRLEIAGVDELRPHGFKAFEYPAKGRYALLLRHEDGTFSAFSQRCPHLGCSVFLSEHSGKLECPCHEGFFDAKTGDVLAGPPQRGLAKIELEVADGKVFAVGGGEA
jgi:nitrite reductase/ring-hydroxylating ferredoxin subunit